MSEFKGTPGPWMWHYRSKQSGYELVHPRNGYLIVMDFTRFGMSGGQPRFATWDGEHRGRMGGIMRKAMELVPLDQHPDARLIAAAPDLLAAAQRAIVKYQDSTCIIPACDCEVCQLRAAVEKAVG